MAEFDLNYMDIQNENTKDSSTGSSINLNIDVTKLPT